MDGMTDWSNDTMTDRQKTVYLCPNSICFEYNKVKKFQVYTFSSDIRQSFSFQKMIQKF